MKSVSVAVEDVLEAVGQVVGHAPNYIRGEQTANRMLSSAVSQSRSCIVSLRDVDGITHTVRVQASSLFEAAARAVSAFREQGWSADALTPNATLRVEVHVPPVVHDVPLKAVERWLRSPSASPREMAVKRRSAPDARRSADADP